MSHRFYVIQLPIISVHFDIVTYQSYLDNFHIIYGRDGQPVRDEQPQFSMCCCKKEPHVTRGHTCTKIICMLLVIVYISFIFIYLITML